MDARTSKKRSIRTKNDKDESSEDEQTIVRKRQTANKSKSNDVENKEDLKAMDEDITERDAFVSRLQERESKSTKKMDSGGLTAEQIKELATRGSIQTKSKDKETIERMREISRQAYLEKREDKELKLLEIGMKDEDYLFNDIQLTAEEKHRIELNKKILSMAKDKYRFDYKDDGYHIPDGYEDDQGRIIKEKRDAALTARYEPEEQVKTEQELWEEDQARIASVHFGSKDNREKNENYDYVFEDQIDFISHELLKGTIKKTKEDHDQNHNNNNTALYDKEDFDNNKLEMESNSQSLTEHEKILIGRKKLPVYPYREEFLQAVKEKKILVVVGETGSGKTTQIPQYLHEAGWSKLGKIGCTQPRRVAAMSVAGSNFNS